MSAAKITTTPPLHAELIPLELAAGVALTDCKHKNHPSRRQSKSDDITGSNSSFINRLYSELQTDTDQY